MDEDINLNVSTDPDVQVSVTPDQDIQVTLVDVGGPKGDTGPAGPEGPQGAQGPQGDVAVVASATEPGSTDVLWVDTDDTTELVGLPAGGTTGQVLAKVDATDYNAEWVTGGGGGGAVDSVNGQTGVVVVDADDIDDTATTNKFVTSADITKLSNLSGTNTGDQDLSSYATKTGAETLTNKTISGSNNTLSNIAQSSVTNLTTDLAGKAASAHSHAISDVTSLQTSLDGKAATSHTHVATTDLTATGTKDATTFLRGDDTWAVPAGSGAVDSVNGATGVVVLDADDIDDTSTTHKFTTASDISKLAGIETGATANDTDANLLARANHTGTQTASTISDFNTAADARITAATGVSVQGYSANTTTLGNTTTGTGAIVRATSPALVTPTGIVKGDVGLGNVDNTSDANKPISSATQSALDAKATIVSLGLHTDSTTAHGATGAVVGTTNTQTLTNKTLTDPKINQIDDTNGNASINVSATASAVNYIDVINAAAGFAPSIKAAGSDANITLYMAGKGTGSLVMADGNAKQIIEGVGVASAVNYLTATNAATGNAPVITATGSDTNVSLNLATKGTGTVQVNGSPVATLQAVYPVGSIYISTVSTNPNTLFGFGTWAAYAEGRVLVGKAASGTFGTAGATMGAETHTLTESEMPSHTHNISARNSSIGGSWISGAHTGTTGVTVSTGSAGSGSAHNNIQPSIVVYMWHRTA